MKRYYSVYFILIVSFQSCYTYKEISLADIEKNKTYHVRLINGKKPLKLKYTKKPNVTDSLYIEKEGILFGIPVNQIQTIKRRKVSPIPTIGIAALSSVGIIWFTNELGKEETLTERLVPD